MPRGREEKRKARPGVSHGVVCSGGGDCMTVRLVVEGLVDWLAVGGEKGCGGWRAPALTFRHRLSFDSM